MPEQTSASGTARNWKKPPSRKSMNSSSCSVEVVRSTALRISHEINNPLEAVINLLYLAGIHDRLPQEVGEYLQAAQNELARVSQIATQSLRFHRQTTKPSRVGAAELIDSVVDLYQGRLFNSDIEVHRFYASSLRILCFENDIRQVLNNLIANAIDAMRQGGRLLLRTHDTTDWKSGRKGIRLTVADTGHGMAEGVKERLFDAFYTTKDLNGTGLVSGFRRGSRRGIMAVSLFEAARSQGEAVRYLRCFYRTARILLIPRCDCSCGFPVFIPSHILCDRVL